MRFVSITALAAGAVALGAAPVLASNAHDGVWVIDPARSFWSNIGTLSPSFKASITLTFLDNKLVYHSINTTKPDKPYISDHVTTLDGTPSPFPNQERFNQVSVKQTGPDDLQILKMKDGDVIAGEFWTFSADGERAIRRGVAKSPNGESHAYQEVMVRP